MKRCTNRKAGCKGDPTRDTSETKKVVREYYEQFRSNVFENLVEIDGFLKTDNAPGVKK